MNIIPNKSLEVKGSTEPTLIDGALTNAADGTLIVQEGSGSALRVTGLA